MKILYIIDSLGVGGAEVLLKNTLLELQKHNFEITVYTLQRTNSFVEKELENTNINIIYNDKSFYSFSHIFAIKSLLQKSKFDVIHVHLFPAQLWVALALWLANTKNTLRVTTEHNTHNRRWGKFQWKYIDFLMYNSYHKIITISNATQKKLIKWQPKISHKCQLIYNGIPTTQFKIIKKRPAGVFNLLTIGRLDTQKGHSFLLDVLSQLKSKKWHLHLLGEGPLLDSLVIKAQRLNISENISFHGFKANISEYFDQTTLYVQPSKWEGFGIATLEAMNAGLPVFASDVEGLNEVVSGAGILLPYGETEAWANQLDALMKNPKELAELSLKSQQQAQEFSLEKHINNLLELYNFKS